MESKNNLKYQYFQHFEVKETLSKVDKELKIAHFTDKAPSGYPKIAVLKEFIKIREEYIKEAKFLKKLSKMHPSIVKPYYSAKVDGKFRIFMECCECGSVSRVIKKREEQNHPWTDSELINHYITISEVIKTLHEKDFVHRDMKPDNIFVQKNEVLKIGDFGDSKQIIIKLCKYTATGTLVYMSPSYQKIWKSLPLDKDGKKRTQIPLAKEEEVWSVGKTFYEMAALKIGVAFPEKENKYFEIVENDMSSRPPKLINLLKWMLKDIYTERPTISQVLEELKEIRSEISTTESNHITFPLEEVSFEIQEIYGSIDQDQTEGFVDQSDSLLRAVGIDTGNTQIGVSKQDEDNKLYEYTTDINGIMQAARTGTLEPAKIYCFLCITNSFTHECGLEYHKEQLKSFILTSLEIQTEFTACRYCLKPFSDKVYYCLRNHFN